MQLGVDPCLQRKLNSLHKRHQSSQRISLTSSVVQRYLNPLVLDFLLESVFPTIEVLSAILLTVTARDAVARKLRFVLFSHVFMQRKFHTVYMRAWQDALFVFEMFRSVCEAVASITRHPGVEVLCPKEET